MIRSVVRARSRVAWSNRGPRKTPGATKLAKALVPFYADAIESFDLRDYDVVLSSHRTLAKGIVRTADRCTCASATPRCVRGGKLPHDEIKRASRAVAAVVHRVAECCLGQPGPDR
jgi:hypothetical protein